MTVSAGPVFLMALVAEVGFFGRQKQAWLATFLELWHGIPSHDTFGHVFGLLDPSQMEVCFAAWVRSLTTALRDMVVDGKAVWGSNGIFRDCGSCT